MDGQAAEHRLDTEPATSHQGANQARHVGTEDAEGRAQQHRKGNAVLGAGKGIQGQRNQYHGVGQQDRQQCLAHGQPEIGGEHAAEGIGRHADRHADPQRGDVPFVPGALLYLGWSDVVVVPGAVEDVAAGVEFIQAITFTHLRSGLLHGHSTVLVFLEVLARA
ncbi:hypothetical protein D3C79_714450 [compost metagenome]